MTDDELVKQTALRFLQTRGPTVTEQLRECAEIAAGMGDGFSAETWEDIAAAVERLASRD